MKKATIRIEDGLAARLQAEMGNLTAGCTVLVEAYASVRQYGIKRFQEIFSLNELSLMLDAENGVIFSPRMIQGWVGHVHDACYIDNLHLKYSVDPQVLLEKLGKLSDSDLVIIHDWMNYYWYGKLKNRPPIEEYLLR